MVTFLVAKKKSPSKDHTTFDSIFELKKFSELIENTHITAKATKTNLVTFHLTLKLMAIIKHFFDKQKTF